MLNQSLGRRYKVIQTLGEGGLAQTYIAEDYHRPSHPKCVVKLLKPASKDPRFLHTATRLFYKEAEILEKLGEHSQIPRLLAYFEENQEFYIVQEFIDGDTLSTELPPDRRWSESKVISMLQDVLQILKFVHSYRVIHRDIKPSNLIARRKDNRLVLIDFGAVKEIGNPRIVSDNPANNPTTKKTISIGTQGYMPTEQVRGKPRLNSDIYALGMIGIQALTGVEPINLEEDEEGEIIWQNRATVSCELAAILNKMVRYHFKDRYQCVTEVLKDLKSLINHRQVTESTPVTRQINSEVAPKSKLKESKVALDTEQLRGKASCKLNLEEIAKLPQTETKIAFKSELATVASDRDKKVNLVDLGILSKIFKNLDLNFLDLNFAPTLVTPQKSRLVMGVGVIAVIMTVFAGYSYLDRRKAYLQAKQRLEQIEKLKVAEKYSECVQQAKIFPQNYAKLNPQLESLLLECGEGEAKGQLAEAKQLAEQSKLKDAIAIVAKIPQDRSVYAEAQKLMSQWSEAIWEIASNQYQEGKLESAKAIAKAVPTASPIAQKVETTIQQWDREWEQDRTHLETARKKLDESRWQDAIIAAKKVSENAYSQKQSQQIIQKAEAEMAAFRKAVSRQTYNSLPRRVYRTYSNPPTSQPLIREHNKKFNPAYNSQGDWVKERLGR